MTAIEALRVLRQRWWILLAACVIATAAAFAYARLVVEPRWRSSVLIQATGRLDYGNFLALEKELRPLAEQVRQLSIMREVDLDLHTDLSPSRILDHTRAEPVQDSGQIRIDVEDSDPHRAEQLSLEIADVYTREHNAAEQGKLREERVILSTLDRDNVSVLIWPQIGVLIPAVAVLSLVVAALVVLGQVYIDDSIRSPADVERFIELPLFGVVPRYHPNGTRAAPTVPRATRADLNQPVTPPTTAARR